MLLTSQQVEYKQKLRNKSNTGAAPDHDKVVYDELIEQDQDPVNELLDAMNKVITPDLGSNSNNNSQEVVEIPVINMDDFKVVNLDDKLNLLMAAINKINTNFHYKFDALNRLITDGKSGILMRVKALEKDHEELTARLDDLENDRPAYKGLCEWIAKLEKSSSNIQDDIAVLKGFTEVHDKAIHSSQCKIVNLTSRSMADNITILGLMGDDGKEMMESCKVKVLAFLTEDVKVPELTDDEVIVAHRTGTFAEHGVRPRLMVVKCAKTLRHRVFKYTHNLKDARNARREAYYVKPQLPEPLLTEQWEIDDKIKEVKKKKWT